MNARERFLNACRRGTGLNDRPPVWLMRQAGRYLPEYRALKENYTFHEMVKTPELAAQVTMQPLLRFPLDAAIIFSDILVIPEALGQPYHFRESGGIEMEYKLTSSDKITAMEPDSARPKLEYVGEAIKLVKNELGNKTALIGFCGSPWTLACYMIQGNSDSKLFESAKHMAYSYPSLFESLLEKLTATIIDYLRMQIDSGVDAIQIFDSFGGLCNANDYWRLSLQWIHNIMRSLSDDIPIILYSNGMGHMTDDLLRTDVNVLSLDWRVKLDEVRSKVGKNVTLQGNLDPSLLNGKPEVVREETKRMLDAMVDDPSYIVNLGHGILPGAMVENVEALVETVCEYRPKVAARA